MTTAARNRVPIDVAMLAGMLGVVFAAAGLGSWLTMQGMPQWYDSLARPAFSPPNWVFGPVWSLLYLMMAIAAWLVWRNPPGQARRTALLLFALQLALNVAWSGLFFGLRSPGLAFVEIVFLWGAILATLLAFWRINVTAGGLLVPYLAWVTFAGVLNFAFWWLNS
jgi:tryptophan-rich sensory protein